MLLPRDEPTLIGMVHLLALPGSPGWGGSIAAILERAERDAEALLAGGCDALLVENMHDLPYLRGRVEPETVATMAVAASRVAAFGAPFGVQVLAAANREALGVAVASGARFIRAEAYAYAHVADEGWLDACAAELARARAALGADVAFWADVKKKHAAHAVTADLSLADVARGHAFAGADALVVTGSETGRPTSLDDVDAAREAGLPVIVGSGVTPENARAFVGRADAVIVGSWLKEGGDWRAPVDVARVRAVASALRGERLSDEGALSSLLDRVGRWNLRRLGARGRMVDGPGGAALHLYELPGGGDVPLVLLHGVGSSASTFGPLVKRLLPSFGPIVLPEAPAHGKSAAPAGGLDAETLFTSVAAALDGLDAAPFVLYGNSLGGGAALRYAIERPERVRALVLLSPAGARTDQDELDALVATFRLETTGEARAFMRRLFHKKRWWQRLAARDLRRRLAHPPVRDMLAQAEVGDQLDPRDVEGLPMPVLFMWGEAERVLPASHLAWFRAHLPPQARVVEPPHFGHSAYIEYPADVAREIIAFCAPADAVSAA